MRPQTASQEEKLEETEEEDRNEDELRILSKRLATRKSRFYAEEERLSKNEKGVKSRNEYLQWLQE